VPVPIASRDVLMPVLPSVTMSVADTFELAGRAASRRASVAFSQVAAAAETVRLRNWRRQIPGMETLLG
jgi:hypothetical protein